MIARVWHGYATPEHADAYEAMLKPEPLPGIGKVKGYKGSYLLRRTVGTEVEFVTILLWDSLDAVRAVAGPDYENAVVPEERRPHLARYDSKAAHYEIVASHQVADMA
jgi:heme-degrading monooxygenase HmoA